MNKFVMMLLVTISSASTIWSGSSLTFGGNTSDAIEIKPAASINNLTAYTVIMRIYPSKWLQASRIYSRLSNGAVRNRLEGSPAFLKMTVDRPVDSDATGSTEISTNVWQTVAVTYSEDDGVRLFYSSTTISQMAEEAYSARTAGSGATVADSNNSTFIANTNLLNSVFSGNVGEFDLIAKRMSLAEIQNYQFNQNVDSMTVIMMPIGITTGTIHYDISGHGNQGVATGPLPSTNGPPIAYQGGPY